MVSFISRMHPMIKAIGCVIGVIQAFLCWNTLTVVNDVKA